MRISSIISELTRLGMEIYRRPFELNIVGVRSASSRPNSFDDSLHVFYLDDNQKAYHHLFPITTDPGTYWLQNPIAPKGTAILEEGQYRNAYGISRHRGRYYALCQIHRPVTVIRDFNRDSILDFRSGKKQSGMFGINIHRASSTGTSYEVNRHSAGCQVFQKASDFELFMRLCEAHRKRHGNAFTYSLLDARSLSRSKLRKLLAGLLLVPGTLGAIWLGSKLLKK